MAVILNASTTAGLVTSADTSGNLDLQAGGVTKIAVTSAGVAVTGTLSASGAFTPNQTTGITGTTTNNDAATGYVGEYISATRAIASAISMTTATPANITSITLTAGDWDVQGWIGTDGNVATLQKRLSVCTTTSSATMDYYSEGYGDVTWAGSGDTIYTNGIGYCQSPTKRYSLSSTTTIYLVLTAVFTTNICTGFGYITARRVR